MGREQHIATDRLTAMAFIVRAPEDRSPESADDRQGFDHLSRCDECASRFGQLLAEADGLREFAFAETDALFPETRLEAQRSRILDRLAHLGQAARVLAFPSRTREAVLPAASSGRRWISVAAAAGLIIGLVAGQMLHFVPSAQLPLRDDGASIQASGRTANPMVLPASAAMPVLTEDELMEEVETAVQVRRVRGLRALDALTPTAADLLASGRD